MPGPATGNEAYQGAIANEGWESQPHKANAKILQNLGVLKREFGETGGTRLSQAPLMATSLGIAMMKTISGDQAI